MLCDLSFIMEWDRYNEIINKIRSFNGLYRDCENQLKQFFPGLSKDTLYSILCTEIQYQMRGRYPRFKQEQEKYHQKFQEEVDKGQQNILIKMSKNHTLPPCLMARLILRQLYGEKTNIYEYLKDTNKINDGILAKEVFECSMYDNLYGPLADAMRGSLGEQYEIRLRREAENLGLAWRDEDYLRKHDYDRTPDLWLEVPVAIDGLVVNWIESKALFGDERNHKSYMKEQYQSYWNRFGPGLIIYWFGYLRTLTKPHDKRFLIKDHLPIDIKTLSSNTQKIGKAFFLQDMQVTLEEIEKSINIDIKSNPDGHEEKQQLREEANCN